MSNGLAIVEDEVRELVRRRGLDPVAEPGAVQVLVDDVISDYLDRAVTSSLPPLGDTVSVARSVLDSVAGFGPLQPFLDDTSIEEIWINEPGRVFVARRGRSELTSDAERLAPRPRSATFPPMNQVGRHDPPLAELMGEHARAVAAYVDAVNAVQDAMPPGGPMWRLAAAADRATAANGIPHDLTATATARLLRGHPELVAGAVLAAGRADALLDLIIDTARQSDALRKGAEADLDEWVESACRRIRDAVTRRSRATLAAIEEEIHSVYAPRRALYEWTVFPNQNYRGPAGRTGVDQRLAAIMAQLSDQLAQFIGYKDGMFGGFMINQLMPEGSAADGQMAPDVPAAAGRGLFGRRT